MKILVVDDREEERYLAETLLKGSGYEVVTAVNGAEALEKLRAEGFDMIVSDVLMPVMDGFRLCRECKGDEKLKDISFVFYTATYKDERDEELASKVGADKYIRKPIEPEEFVKLIQSVFRDVEEGKIGPKKPVLEEGKEVLKLYSERLIAKLEKKMLDLEAEITERKKAQAEVERLNRVLYTIRRVNQLIVREKERDKLLKSACTTLVKTRDYESTCICLFDESGMLVAHAEAGLNEDFLPMVGRLKHGELPDCIKRTLIQSGVVITKVSPSTCGDCPLVKMHSGKKVVTIRLEHGGKVYGLLKLQLSGELSMSREEQSLLQEVTGDIAFALHDMELEEERKRLEHSLNERVKELQCLYGIASIAARPGLTLDKLHQEVVNLLSQSWQYPEITCARIIIGDKEFKTSNYRESKWKLSSGIKIGGEEAGIVEVGYLEERPEIDEGPFLKEERRLISAVAERLERITEHKRAEELYRTLVDSSPVGVYIIQDGKVQFVNPQFRQLTGYGEDELFNMESLELVHPEDRERVRKNAVEMLKGNLRSPYEFRVTNKGGETIWAMETVISVHYKGKRATLGNFMDITERMRAEEAVRESEENLRAYLESAPDGVYLNDLNGTFLYGNKKAEEIIGYGREELIGSSFLKLNLLPGQYLEKAGKLLELNTMGRPTGPDEFELIRKDGSRVWVEINTTPTKQRGETVVISFVRDITERKQMEAKAREVETLKEVDRLRSGLLANVSHELRTPLTSIKGFASTLLRSDVKWSEEEQRDYLQTIDQETDRLIRLISDLLDMSRLDAGALKLEKDNYHISEILDAVSSRLASLTERHQLQVIIPSDLPPVFVDQMRIGQVLTNLVENATKYSSEGSPITIEAQLAGDQINVSVTDRGEGIPSELLDKVFDRFYQAESIVTGRKSGTGLGLSICRGIIESHGGRIWVDSKLGEGSKFSFSLPVGKGEEELA